MVEGLERKVRAAGRPWTVGDIAMVADGQWAVPAGPRRDIEDAGAVREILRRAGDGERVELSLDELRRAADPEGDDGAGREADGD